MLGHIGKAQIAGDDVRIQEAAGCPFELLRADDLFHARCDRQKIFVLCLTIRP